MEDSYLISLLRAVNEEEFGQLYQFCELNLLNDLKYKAQISLLLGICHKQIKAGSSNLINKQELFFQIFPKDSYIEGKIEKVMHYTAKCVKNFLITKHFLREENEFYQNLDFFDILRERKLEDKALQILSKLRKTQQANTNKDFNYYLRQFHIEFRVHYLESISNKKKGDVNISNLLAAVEGFYQSRRVALLNRFILQQKVTTLQPSEVIDFNLAIQKVPAYLLTESPTLSINYLILDLLQKETFTFQEIEIIASAIKRNEHQLDWESLQEFYTYLRNFCILLIMQEPERLELYQFLFSLYKENLQNKLLFYEGKLSPSRFFAITENALICKEFDWAFAFIEENKDKIFGETDDKSIYRLNLSRYYFHLRDFNKSLSILPQHFLFNDYLLLGKRIELMALYETKSDLLSYRIDSFKMFLSRTSSKLLSDKIKKVNSEFLNLLTQLTDSIPGDKKRADTMIKRVREKKHAVEWLWLKEKAESLKNP
ncbi:MAG: hypothetical protein J0M29_19145 [Chitinophagales bacterium]|nr:hypothetical protein [Chitinophagales bacterium]